MYGKRKAQTALGRPTKKARKADSGVFMPVPKYNLPLKDRSKPGDGVMRITRKMRQNAAFSAAVAVADNGGYQQTAYIPFQLDQLPGYATLAAAFAEYRIESCTVTFIPKQAADTYSTAAGNSIASKTILGWFQDDSGVAIAAPFLANENPWLQRQGYRTRLFDREINIKCSPSPLTAMTNPGGALETAIGAPAQWISTNNVDLPHYGLKVRAYSDISTLGTFIDTGRLYVTYTVQFRQPQ